MSGNGDDRLRSALRDSYRALADNGIAALVVGGMAISYHLDGEPKVDHDIDLFIAEADLEKAMEALESSGFDVTRTHPTWLFKGRRDGATVDVLYRRAAVAPDLRIALLRYLRHAGGDVPEEIFREIERP